MQIVRAQMERCAQAFASPTFMPHITVCTDPAVTTLAALDPLTELPLTLSLAALGFGNDYFHGCYLVPSHDRAARALQERCALTLGGKVPPQYPPHLSVAYGVLNREQRAQARTLITDLPLEVSFDRLELWDNAGPVSSWRKLA